VDLIIRNATIEDVDALRELIEASARELGKRDYTPEQIEAALKGAWGVDTQLIRDKTYFVVEADKKLAGCGGWSRRKTLFGSDARAGREPELLEPHKDAARIRAFFVHPDFARRGIGRKLLERCEAEAKKEGFTRAELAATLPGVRLYEACGYEKVERMEYPLGEGVTIDFVTMRKALALTSS
jgi:N-acetylglutamate synthase-like GNAT family acetyltransferase